MEEKYLKILIFSLILLVVILWGRSFLFKSSKQNPPQKPPFFEKEERSEYKPILEPTSSEEKEIVSTQKRKETKEVKSLQAVEPGLLSKKEKEILEKELTDANQEFRKKPTPQELEDLRRRGVIIY